MARTIPPEERLIFALDVSTAREALDWVQRLRGEVRFFKIGLELFLGGGWDVVHRIHDQGVRIFLDLKLLDIPQTVSRALKVIGRHVDAPMFVTVHGFTGGLDPAQQAAIDPRLKLLGVTLLTSQGPADLAALGIALSPADYVLRLAERSLALGCAGVVASGEEAARLRRRLGPEAILVVPGVRPAGGSRDDQQRVSTPWQAIGAGADYLVVGRPIREAADPPAAARAIQEEIRTALSAPTP
jgi:orotidine-5'-phosphate decarboxylase